MQEGRCTSPACSQHLKPLRSKSSTRPRGAQHHHLLQGVTPDGDSALHVVAAGGDGDSYLKSASVIYGKARHLLDARNKGRSTPLHRAARAGNVEMLSLLIRLAGEEGDEEEER
jgi:hypothetical protein